MIDIFRLVQSSQNDLSDAENKVMLYQTSHFCFILNPMMTKTLNWEFNIFYFFWTFWRNFESEKSNSVIGFVQFVTNHFPCCTTGDWSAAPVSWGFAEAVQGKDEHYVCCFTSLWLVSWPVFINWFRDIPCTFLVPGGLQETKFGSVIGVMIPG